SSILSKKKEPSYSFCLHKHYCKAAKSRNKIHCDCGENSNEPLAWQWDQVRAPASARFLPTHVACHETLSTGTAVLLGDTILEPGGHHFFEVKLLTDLYGTDTMVGLVTDQFDPDSANQRFVSLLGADSHSWGLSFHGTIRHAGRSQPYTSLFGKGSIIGVYANLRAGTVEFFLNRRSLGVAFSGLSRPGDGGGLLPAFCTTAANTCVRLVTALSVADSLQFQATAVISRSLPHWSLALPAPICRLIRRFPWLDYVG
ncbi:SPRY domain-containing SOCS box protein 3-like, partial [Pollicipes pollicipes]